MQNFRGFKELELKDLGAVTILVGENNTGKTSVLEAVELLCNPLDIGQVLTTARGRDRAISFSFNNRMPLLDSIEWLFHHEHKLMWSESEDTRIGKMILQAQTHHSNTEYTLFYSETLVIEKAVELNGKQIAFADAEEVKAFEIMLTHSEQFINGMNITNSESYVVTDHFRRIKNRGKKFIQAEMVTPVDHRLLPLAVKSLTQSIMRGDRANIINLLQAFDENIEGLELLSPDGRSVIPYIRHKVRSFVPLSMYGDGIRRLIVLASAVLKAKNGVLMVDEIETALHSKVLVKVFSWLMDACHEYDVQLIVTTHSLEAVDALIAPLADEDDSDDVNLENLKNLVAFRLINRDGQTTAKRFSGDALYSLRYEYGQDVR